MNCIQMFGLDVQAADTKKEMDTMANKKSGASVTTASDFLAEALNRSFEVIHDITRATCDRSADASITGARYLVKFQQSSVKAGLGLVAKAQKVTEKSLRDAMKKGKWLPGESRDIVEEWSRMMKSGVDEFTRVTDKSFELLLQFLDRVEKEHQPGPEKKTARPAARKKAPAPQAKTPPAKRKATTGKKTVTK